MKLDLEMKSDLEIKSVPLDRLNNLTKEISRKERYQVDIMYNQLKELVRRSLPGESLPDIQAKEQNIEVTHFVTVKPFGVQPFRFTITADMLRRMIEKQLDIRTLNFGIIGIGTIYNSPATGVGCVFDLMPKIKCSACQKEFHQEDLKMMPDRNWLCRSCWNLFKAFIEHEKITKSFPMAQKAVGTAGAIDKFRKYMNSDVSPMLMAGTWQVSEEPNGKFYVADIPYLEAFTQAFSTIELELMIRDLVVCLFDKEGFDCTCSLISETEFVVCMHPKYLKELEALSKKRKAEVSK
jgi:hypothetical protein